MQHFPTEYDNDSDFDARNKKNHELIRKYYVPDILASGMNVGLKMDVDPIYLSDDAKGDYPNPNDFSAYAGLRSPDLMGNDPRMKIINSPGLAMAYLEVKDFPQLSKYNATGCEARLVMRYLSIQHLYQIPVVMLFRDEDRPATDRLGELKSAFGKGPYGGLIWDLMVHEASMSPHVPHKRETPSGNKYYPQVIWRAQNPITNAPIMMPMREIADQLRSGEVSMRRVDPAKHQLWETLGSDRWKKEWIGKYDERSWFNGRRKPMRVPKDGLAVFTAT